MMIRLNSLGFRLFALATAWTLFVLPVTAIYLTSVYRQSVEHNFDKALRYHLTSLLANTQKKENGTLAVYALPDPPFNLPFSGQYWQIKLLDKGKQDQPVSYYSESLLDAVLKLPSEQDIPPNKDLVHVGYVQGPEKQRLRVIERQISLGQGENYQAYSFAVARDSSEIDSDLAQFSAKLNVALSILGLGLILAPFVQIQFGLRPLRAISSGLMAIRSGKAKKLEGHLPTEIQPLQRELNALIESNYDIVERSRNHVGNLAHALKTPLSVIKNEADAKVDSFAEKVTEQTQIMGDLIKHHLDRARMAARVNIISGVTEINPLLEDLVRALGKIYGKQGVEFSLECPNDLKFQGEENDLQEMIGNLLDNSGKWAESKVSLNVDTFFDPEKDKKMLRICVDDDGPGLSKEQIATALQRGRRLDESQPGSGLGLSIVTDLVDLYKGKFLLEKSPQSGLRAELQLPAV